MTPEPKVLAATGGAVGTGIAVWVLQTFVFHGTLPVPLSDAVQVVAPAVVAFASGWLAKHVQRPEPPVAAPVVKP